MSDRDVRKTPTPLPGVFLLEGAAYHDARGSFSEVFSARDLAAVDLTRTFVQDNWARSTRGVLRGLHYQLGHPQAKLLRVLAGEVFDVVVDVRRGSPTFGQSCTFTLRGDTPRGLYVPEGFAHGYYVLSAEAHVFYKCTDFYAPREERGIAWNDPRLAIPWPLIDPAPVMSPKDLTYGPLDAQRDDDLPTL